MADEVADNVPATQTAAPVPKKKAKTGAANKPKAVPSHPKVSEMVLDAITNLKERGGSSLQAIKKYVGANYKVDMDRLTPFVKKYLKNAVVNGALVQTKGKGATGSFKLNATSHKAKEATKKGTGKKQALAVVKKTKSTSSSSSSKKPPKTKSKQTNEKQKKKVAKKPTAPAKKNTSKAKSPKKPTPKPVKPKAPKAKKLKPVVPKKNAVKKVTKK